MMFTLARGAEPRAHHTKSGKFSDLVDFSQGIFSNRAQKMLRGLSVARESHNHQGSVVAVQSAIGDLSLLQGGRADRALSAGFRCSAAGVDEA